MVNPVCTDDSGDTRDEMTLFSEAKYKFLPVSEGDDIPTQPFLHACSEIVPFFGSNIVSNSVLFDNSYIFFRRTGIYSVHASESRYQWQHTSTYINILLCITVLHVC